MYEDHSYIYKIEILGHLDPSWSEWLDGFQVTAQIEPPGKTITTITGAIRDQAALRGVVMKIWDLSLSIISIQRVSIAC